jgi:integrase
MEGENRLTTAAHSRTLSPKGGGYMGGSIQKHGDRFRVGVYWHGKTEWFSEYMGQPIEGTGAAGKLLAKIQTEIDARTFDPRTYRPNSPLTLSAYSDIWLAACTACANTKKVYRHAIKKATDHFGKDQDIRELTHSKLLIFQKSLSLSDDGKYNVLSALKTMLRFYHKDTPSFVLPTFPALTKTEPETTRYLTFEEQQTVLGAIPERHRPIFIVMMEYGIRPQEATALKWDCVTADKIIFKRSHSEYQLHEQTKTGAIREERITTRAKEAIDGITRNSVWVFTKNERGSHYDSKALNRIWKAACLDASVEIGLYESVRHSLGCQLADAGYSIDFIQDVYKHTSIKTTRRYAKRQRGMIGEALENRGQVIPFGSVVRNGTK